MASSKKRPIAEVIAGMGRDRPRPFMPKDDDAEDGVGGDSPDPEEAKRSAVEALFSAFKKNDVDAGMSALESFHTLCADSSPAPDEDEEEPEENEEQEAS